MELHMPTMQYSQMVRELPKDRQLRSTCLHATSPVFATAPPRCPSGPLVLSGNPKNERGRRVFGAPTLPSVTLSFEADLRNGFAAWSTWPMRTRQSNTCSHAQFCDTKMPTRHPSSDNAFRILCQQTLSPLISHLRIAPGAGQRLTVSHERPSSQDHAST